MQWAVAVLAVAMVLPVPALAIHDATPEPEPPAPTGEDGIYPMVFPVVGDSWFSNDWHHPRPGGRVHLGTDVIADRMTPVVAVADGVIDWYSGGDRCCNLGVGHDDGWSSRYIHLNNDSPGTDDGLGWGIADGIEPGTRVEAGQLIGWVGDSGNAEETVPHVHFELHAPGLGPVNPYPHLLEALHLDEAGGVPARDLCPRIAGCDSVTFVDELSRFHRRQFVGQLEPPSRFYYGQPGDVPLMGDWNCDGTRTPAMYRPTNGFMYLRNSNDFGVAEVDYFYGLAQDIPLAGDFDGDGCDTLAIYRPTMGRVYVKDSLGTGVADYDYFFGDPGDVPFVGDFDGDGIDTVGLYRQSTGFVYFRNSHTSGPAELSFYYGSPGDVILAGDWDGDGDDTVAVYRPSDGRLYLSLANRQGPADIVVHVGEYRFALVSTARVAPPPPITVTVAPDDDLAAVVAAAPPLSTFHLRPGVYRGEAVVPGDGHTFVGGDGVVMSGREPFDAAWTRDGSRWYAPLAPRDAPHRPGACAEGDGDHCWHPQGVAADGVELTEETTLTGLAAGEWWYDDDRHRLYLGFDPAGAAIEVQQAEFAFGGDDVIDVTIRDVVIEHYDTGFPLDPAVAAGAGWTLERVEIRHVAGSGITVAAGTTVRDSHIHHVHDGVRGSLHRHYAGVEITGTEIGYNAGAGVFLSRAVDAVVAGNHVHDNASVGILADAAGTLIEDNHVADNGGRGLILQAGDGGAVVRHNRFEHNNLDPVPWNADLVFSAVEDVEFHHNTVTSGGKDGLLIILDGGDGPYAIDVHHNSFELRADPRFGVTVSSELHLHRLDDPGITFRSNTYQLASPAVAAFEWGTRADDRTPSEWQALGHDADSTFLYD